MTKKDFKGALNPATMFINIQPPAEPTPKELKPIEKKIEVVRPKEETKSKRFNLLLTPTLFKDIEKIATIEKDSVNNLINNALIKYREENKSKIDKYNEVFGD